MKVDTYAHTLRLSLVAIALRGVCVCVCVKDAAESDGDACGGGLVLLAIIVKCNLKQRQSPE